MIFTKNNYVKFLRAVLVILGVGILGFAVFYLPYFAELAAAYYEDLAFLKTPILIFVYISAVPFYIALFQGYKICNTIVNNNPFSTGNLKSFKIASFSALAVSVMYFAGTGVFAILKVERPILYIVFVLIGVCALVFTLLCEVLNQLLSKAIELREENDLTV